LVEGEYTDSDFKHNIIYDNDKRIDGYKDDDLRIFFNASKVSKIWFVLQFAIE